MSTAAQIAANQANAQLSLGPTSEEGKAISSRNRTTHGLSYEAFTFCLLPWEDAGAYSELYCEFCSEYRPQTQTEKALVERMTQHHWLRNRAEYFESQCFSEDGTVDEKRLALYMRYRTSHERGFHKCLTELLKLRAEKRKAEIGFESQKQKTALNEARIRLANAKANLTELDSDIRQTCEAPLPGHARIPFEDLSAIFRVTLRELNDNLKVKLAA